MIFTPINKFFVIVFISSFFLFLITNLINISLEPYFLLSDWNHFYTILTTIFYHNNIIELFFHLLAFFFLSNQLDLYHSTKKYLFSLFFVMISSHLLFLIINPGLSVKGSLITYLLCFYALSFPYRPMNFFLTNFFLPSYQICAFFIFLQIILYLQNKAFAELILHSFYLSMTFLFFYLSQWFNRNKKTKLKIVKEGTFLH